MPQPNDGTPEQEFVQCIPQIRRSDPSAESWVDANEYDVDNGNYFLTDPLPAGDFNFIQVADLPSHAASLQIAGMCGVTTEKLVQEREDGEKFILPSLKLWYLPYRILKR